MLKKAVIIWMVSALCLAPASVYSADVLTVDSLIDEAIKHNPDILAARKRWEASVARVPLAKSLENPSIGLTFEKIPRGTLKLNKTMPDDRMLSFSQFLPFFGKLSLKGKIAVVESQIFAAEYKDKELEVVNRLRKAYYELFLNDQERQLSQESLSLLEGIATVAEAKFALGEISQEEVYKIHAEIARLSTAISNLEQERSAQQTLLNTVLNREPEALPVTPELDEDASFVIGDINSFYQATIINQPELGIFSYAIEKNKHAKSLAKKSFFPDLVAGIVQRGITSGGIGPWDLMLSFSVPLWFWKKQKYEVREAIANLEEAEAAYKAMQNKAMSEVKELASKIEIAKNKIRLHKTSLIPILESSIGSSQTAYAAGTGDFMMLLDSQRLLVEARMDYYRALVDYHVNVADLERTVGVALKEVEK